MPGHDVFQSVGPTLEALAAPGHYAPTKRTSKLDVRFLKGWN